jgi:FlaG/FlaF family flagellin (archaellin)
MIIKRNKKAISVMIGYILLISFALVMAIIVYAYIKTYVPKDLASCPDDTSLFIKEATCNNGELNITLKNNGRFNIAGYFIRGTEDIDQDVATVDLVQMAKEGVENQNTYFTSILFDITQENTLKPGDEKINVYNLTEYIYSISIIPTRFQGEGNKKELVACGNSRVGEIIECQP